MISLKAEKDFATKLRLQKLRDNEFKKAFREHVIQTAESMFSSKPVEEICYDLNSNLFEKTKSVSRKNH